jgi:protein-S-isoprenylcysteine O-methyltransferase Ste14
MDPLNIIAGLNLIASFGANISGAKKGLKSTFTAVKERPQTYLQKVPVVISTVILFAFILGIFQVGTVEYEEKYFSLRLIGLIIYLFFSWIQVWAYRSLGDNYSQEMVIFKEHKLIQKGPFGVIRHPQYLSQILMDTGAGLTTLSYIVLPLAIIQIPFLMMRASTEDKMLSKHFKDEFVEYKKRTGFILPFIG